MNKKINQKDYDAILHGRTHLTDYESDLLIPELKYRLEALKEYFQQIIDLCNTQKGSQVFTNSLTSIINQNGLPSGNDENTKSLSDRFFDTIKNQAQSQNIEEIDKILEEYSNISDLKTLGMFLNKVNFLCSSLLAVKNNLFLFKIEGYPFIVNKQTGQTTAALPVQYFITTEPFKIAIDQIMSVADATSKTIHEWHKHTMESKSQYINLYAKNISIRNNKIIAFIQVLTIIFAIILSAFFLTANDPFGLLKRNQELNREIKKLENDKLSLETEINKIKKRLTTQSTGPDSAPNSAPSNQ